MADEYILKETVLNYLKHHSAFKSKSEIIQDIAECEPADVAPVVHAYWIRHENADIICGYYVPSFECSQCGTWKEDDSDFCPDCGAKMDEEKKKNE